MVKHENKRLRLCWRLRPSSRHNVSDSLSDDLIFKNFPLIKTSPVIALLFKLFFLCLGIIYDPLIRRESCISFDFLCLLFPLVEHLIFMGVINKQHFFSWDIVNLSPFYILLLMVDISLYYNWFPLLYIFKRYCY